MEKIIELVKNEIVCLYKDKNNTEKFFLGYIIAFNEAFLLFENIDEEGFVDGISVVRIEDIYLIETNNKYISNIMKKNPKKIDYRFEKSNDILCDFLRYIIDEKKIVDIETNGSESVDLHGIVVDIIDDWIELEVYENNDMDGKSYCRLDTITMIGF